MLTPLVSSPSHPHSLRSLPVSNVGLNRRIDDRRRGAEHLRPWRRRGSAAPTTPIPPFYLSRPNPDQRLRLEGTFLAGNFAKEPLSFI